MDKLPSGNYRVRKQVNGIKYNLIFDHKPTQKEIKSELDKRLGNRLIGKHLTFKQASEQYNDLKEGSLSPATIREYTRMCRRLPAWFVEMDIGDIDDITMQRLIREMTINICPKTVKDRYAYCVAVLRLFDPKVYFNISLPKIVEKEPYLPENEDINKMLEVAKGTNYYIPLKLAMYGLRREEICSLEVSDVIEKDGMYYLYIDKALVQDKNNNWVKNITKTVESGRVVPIDTKLAKEILELGEGRIFNGFPDTIGKFIAREQEKLGMEHFSLHKFRHYFASILADNSVPESEILYVGGWKKNSDVMRKHYRQTKIAKDKEKLDRVRQIIQNK